MAMKSKEIKSKSVQFAKGGKGHMFGQQGANPQQAGESGHAAADGKGAAFAKGGSGKMFGFRPSAPARPGQSGPA
jgi:hypothetical protein